MTLKERYQALRHKLTIKYRFVVLNDKTFEEVRSFNLSRMNVISVLSILTLTVFSITFALVAYTPLKNYVPGYVDNRFDKEYDAIQAQAQALIDTIAYVEGRAQFMNELRIALSDGTLDTATGETIDSASIPDRDTLMALHPADSALRAEFEEENMFSVFEEEVDAEEVGLASQLFYAPVEGAVKDTFDYLAGQYAIDIVTERRADVKATLDGTVVYAGWSVNDGYVIHIQHSNNLLSIYKNNAVVLKKIGNFVRAGEVIAYLGEGGSEYDKPHLKFELWHRQKAVDPLDYVRF